MNLIVYVDESGDGGWSFEQPYGSGGSSRYLTVAYLIIPENLRHIPKRLVKDTYDKFGFDPKLEIKGTDLRDQHRGHIIGETRKMLSKYPVFRLGAMTVKKERVLNHIRADTNKLYNYMLRLTIIGEIEHSPSVTLVRDERSIKVKSGNSCRDYLQSYLWFDRQSTTSLIDLPAASDSNLSLIFIDWIANTVWAHFENAEAKYFNELLKIPSVILRRLYF